MNFDFTEDQLALRDLVRKFVEREMPKDAVADWDAKGVFPEGLLDKMAEIGLMGASVPEEFGGTGGGVVEDTIVLRRVLTGDLPSLAEHAPDAPKELVGACERALQAEASARFDSAADFQATLEMYLDNRERVSNREVGAFVDTISKDDRAKVSAIVDGLLTKYNTHPSRLHFRRCPEATSTSAALSLE